MHTAEIGIKKRKVSKKTKKSWRKHVDIKDVDNYLENVWLEERLGTPLVERKDNELFIVDKSPERKIVNSKLERRSLLISKEPKCFSQLKPLTAVPDPITKRNRVRTPEERKSAIVRSKELSRKLNNHLKLKEKLAIKNRLLAEQKRNDKHKRGQFQHDIWNNDSVLFPQLNKEQILNDTLKHTLKHFGQVRKRKPSALSKRPSVLPTVPVPHPGTSYNPSYEDHQNLLAEIAEKEIKLMKEEVHLNRVTSKMFNKVSQSKKDEDALKELSEGLSLNDDNKLEETDSESDNDPTVKSVNPPVKNMKKTKAQRNREKRQKVLALQRSQEKVEKKKKSDIYKLRALNNQLQFKEKKAEILHQQKQRLKEKKAIEPKILSRVKFEPTEPDFQLGEELSGNLRNAQSVGNLLKDRYKSLQQRNIVAPGTLVLKRSKAKVKKFEKAGYKINWEQAMKDITDVKTQTNKNKFLHC